MSVDVDGSRYVDDVEPRTLLVHHLRERLGKIGTVVGCDTSNCGSCTVLHGDPTASAPSRAAPSWPCRPTGPPSPPSRAWPPTAGALHPVQQAFHELHALQCGFCTPGMILSAVDLLRDNPAPTEAEIREGLSGNLCRCTGYQNIIRAVQSAATALQGSAAAVLPSEATV